MFQDKMRISLSELQEQIQEDLLTYFDGADCDIQFEVCAIVCANFRNFADKYDLKRIHLVTVPQSGTREPANGSHLCL